ncbi:MAG: type II toxin-antitoxin system RelB/DinJ family antitoxin [Patescibacteria group bacterium]
MNTTTIQIRIDTKTKNETKKLFDTLGLDLSSATKLFYVQALRARAIPFEIRTENGFTPSQEREMIKEAEWAKKHAKRYSSVKKMLDDILGPEKK